MGFMANGTVQLNTRIEPKLKTEFDRAAKRAGETQRAALEQAIRDYIAKGNQ
jgi:hypothetical protein